MQHFRHFITQLFKKLQKQSLKEVIPSRSFWIQNILWAIFCCGDINKTFLGIFKRIKTDFIELFSKYIKHWKHLRDSCVSKMNKRVSSINSYKGWFWSFTSKTRSPVEKITKIPSDSHITRGQIRPHPDPFGLLKTPIWKGSTYYSSYSTK